MEFERLIKRISSELSSSAGTRIYLAVATKSGEFLFLSDSLLSYKELLKKFISTNFYYLKVGDYSIPISGKNLIFFKVSDQVIIILFSNRGIIGQFMNFKNVLNRYDENLNDIFSKMDILKEESLPVESVLEERLGIEYERKQFDYYPQLTEFGSKNIEKSKFSVNQAFLLNHSDGKTNLNTIFSSSKITSLEENVKDLVQLLEKRWIKFPNYDIFVIKCIFCGKNRLVFVPKYLAECNPKQVLFKQVFAGECPHSFILKINLKTSKIHVKEISSDLSITDKINTSEFSFKNLASFLGIGILSQILFNLTLQEKIMIIIRNSQDEDFANALFSFLERIFINLTLGDNFIITYEQNYKENCKKYTDFLILDLGSYSIINRPLQSEDLKSEIEMIQTVLNEPDDEKQVLKFYNHYESLISLTEKSIQILEPLKKKISEENLKVLFQNVFQKTMTPAEIQVIRRLAQLHFNVDLSKKIVFKESYLEK
ncbi:MAG: hypothetical protein ACTSVE_14640 [Candidatus Helarchaeota archaeon]